MSEDPTPAIHDLGGAQRFHCTPVEHDETPPDAFGRRVDALRQVLAQKQLMTVDELRRGIESGQMVRVVVESETADKPAAPRSISSFLGCAPGLYATPEDAVAYIRALRDESDR